MLRRLLYGIGVLLVMGFIALVIVTIVYRQYLDTPIDPARGEPAVVKVPKGNLRDVLAVLVKNDLVTQPTLFELHASFTGKATQVQAGTFLLDYRWTPSELLHHLVEGTSPAIRKLRLPPGLNQWKVADRVERAGLGKIRCFYCTPSIGTFARHAGIIGSFSRHCPVQKAGLELSCPSRGVPLSGEL